MSLSRVLASSELAAPEDGRTPTTQVSVLWHMQNAPVGIAPCILCVLFGRVLSNCDV